LAHFRWRYTKNLLDKTFICFASEIHCMGIVEEVKNKREFADLPDSVVQRAVDQAKGDVKHSRAILRKYFGVFMTNKVLKGDLKDDEMLKAHISSSKRDYKKFYEDIFEGVKGVHSVIDLGCGANGFSYKHLKEEIGSVDYVGVEAQGRLVEHLNKYFEDKLYLAHAVKVDLFEVEEVLQILRRQVKGRAVLLFQVVDALESLERDFAKEFIKEIFGECEVMVVSWSIESISGKRKFFTKKKWLTKFFEEHYEIHHDFEKYGERFVVLTKK
jgi:hypothetical protein